MIRDRGPISSLGHGVTSRDVPMNEGESEGPSPNSGSIARALNGHPVMRFFASTAVAVAGSLVLGGLFKKGGLKLAKTIQDTADAGGVYSTRFVDSVTKLRRGLDELEGLTRSIDDTVDPNSKLIFETDGGRFTSGKLTSIQNDSLVLEGGDYLTTQDIQQAGRGITREPPAIWSLRDNIQQALVKNARRLPYELPALYIAQRGVTDPLFGNNQDRRKVKWYNPVDVLADFAKQSVINVGAVTGVSAAGGAALSRSRFYINAPFANNPNLQLTAKQAKTANRFADAKIILEEMGQDFTKFANQASRYASSTAGAFNMAVKEAAENQSSPVFAMQQARRGLKAATEAFSNANMGKKLPILQRAKAFFLGTEVGQENYQGLVDALPAMRGFSHGFRSFGENFKVIKTGYDVVAGAKSYDDALRSISGSPTKSAPDKLQEAIRVVQNQHKSKFSAFAESVGVAMGKGGPANTRIDRKSFGFTIQEQEYRKQLKNYLINNNVDRDVADNFSRTIIVKSVPNASAATDSVSQRITIGRSNIISESDDDFYEQIAKRFRRQTGLDQGPSSDVIKRAIEETDNLFVKKEFAKSLQTQIDKMSQTFFNGVAVPYGRTMLKPQKAVYQDFVGPLTVAKEEFLRRRTAQVLGINLNQANGRAVSNAVVNRELAKRGIDANNFGQLRGFLIHNKAMTSQSSSGGFNLFGMKQLLVDEAFDKGIFNYMQPEQRDIVRNLAGRLKSGDPVSRSIGFSKLDGVYQNKSGEVVDLTRIKSMVTGLGNFFANEFQIPIVKFNPLQMLGLGGPSGVSKTAPFQFVSGQTVQPFGSLETHAADVFVWTKTKNGLFGVKGNLTNISSDEFGTFSAKTLEGQFRPINSRESNIFTRAASFAANRGAILRKAELESLEEGKELSFLERFKKLFDIDEEQPNSLFRLGRRFRNRKTDIYNPAVFANLIEKETVSVGSRRSGRSISLLTRDDGRYSIVNQAGEELYTHKQVLDAYDTFRRATMQYATPLRVMKGVEERLDLNLIFGTKKVSPSQLMTDSEMRAYAVKLGETLDDDVSYLRIRGVNTAGLTRAYSRVQKFLNETDLENLSDMATKSPSVSTRLDEFRNEIYRFMIERNTYLTARGDPSSLITAVDDAINELRRKGLISASQVAEARAAGLSTFLNINAFRTFVKGAQSGTNIANAMASAIDVARGGASQAFANLSSPFTQGTAAIIDSGGVKKATSLVKPFFRRQFGTAAYQMDEMATNSLGNQSATFVPTFGTVAQGVGLKRALMSSAGLTTYSDPSAFSFSSIPMSHGFERLNRYFGTVGLGIDPNKYRGPLDLYARGMVAKRVLPIVATGTGALTIDRTIGGFLNEEDQRGEKVYSPFLLTQAATGVVEARSVLSGITPGGKSYEEKKDELTKGEVPIRQGRFWPLGTTPFEGGKIMYYRPSWYRKLQAGAMFTSDSFGSPVEKFMFGYDFSPLRPLDPYRYERKHYEDRPYPVTGEYFSGPFGPVTDFLNMTVGKLLKPQLKMHEGEVNSNLGQYIPAGQSGAYNPVGLIMSGKAAVDYAPTIPTGTVGGTTIKQYGIAAHNSSMASAAGPMGTATGMARSAISQSNAGLLYGAQYGPPPIPGTVAPSIVPSGRALSAANINYQAGQVGYKMQETFGIYGFGFGSLREGLGFGSQDFEPQRTVMQSASKAYGSTRAFWDMNLGGLGDVPLTAEGALGNIEVSEIIRRFIPKERTNINYLNPIRNTMADKYPFLPGADYFINFQQGDPFTRVPEGELRLPGVAYERFNPRGSNYDQMTQLDILADVAPYSKQFRQLNRSMQVGGLSPDERVQLESIRSQVEQTTKKYEFSDYKYKNSTAEELGIDAKGYTMGRIGEYIAHRDTYFNTKFLNKRTAQEDWERRNVYGATFPEWQRPFESFFEPMLNKATQRSPLTAGIGMAVVGSLFGKSARAKAFASLSGFAAGSSFSSYGNISEAITGDRFVPEKRKKQLAVEEYADILSYVKNISLSNQATQEGNTAAANQFNLAAKRTMYGADIYGASVETLSLSVPKRKREHFKAMIQESNPEERKRILSTSGRLERRMYQAAWGMEVEQRPDLVDYFSRHELPDANWEGWHPNTNMEHVKIKIAQSMGIEMAQMGYYPQQVREATLTNPSYPQFSQQQAQQNTAAELRALMSRNGINGTVTPVMNGFGNNNVQISAGMLKDFAF